MGLFIQIANFYRVKDWFYHLGFVYLGAVYAGGFYLPVLGRFSLAIFLGILYLASGYSYNNICDLNSINRKDFFSAHILFLIFILVGIFCIKIHVTWFILAIFLNYFYSHPRHMWKKNHLFSILFNGYAFSILFLLGALVIRPVLRLDILLMTILFSIIMFPYQIIHEIAHFTKENVGYDSKTIGRYIKQVYFSLLLFSFLAIFLYFFLKLKFIFIMASSIFALAFFITVVSIKIEPIFEVSRLSRIRGILKYIGLSYGVGLWFSFL